MMLATSCPSTVDRELRVCCPNGGLGDLECDERVATNSFSGRKTFQRAAPADGCPELPLVPTFTAVAG